MFNRYAGAGCYRNVKVQQQEDVQCRRSAAGNQDTQPESRAVNNKGPAQ